LIITDWLISKTGLLCPFSKRITSATLAIRP